MSIVSENIYLVMGAVLLQNIDVNLCIQDTFQASNFQNQTTL